MKIEHFKPKCKALQPYIESYYLLTHTANEKKVSYLTFPTLYSVVAAVQHAEHVLSETNITTKQSQTQALATSLVCRFNTPICFQYEGEIKEICIYFKPLGLNAFLEQPLATYSQTTFDAFVPFSEYESAMSALLQMEDKTQLAENVEAYWQSKLVGFDHPFLHKAIDALQKNGQASTAELANAANVSQKTFIHHFATHLCKTPTEYKKILRFRKALHERQTSKEGIKLTELGYITDFFDQSHMIANFKALTGLAPKQFFKQLSTADGSNVSWIFNEG